MLSTFVAGLVLSISILVAFCVVHVLLAVSVVKSRKKQKEIVKSLSPSAHRQEAYRLYQRAVEESGNIERAVYYKSMAEAHMHLAEMEEL